MEFNLLDIVQHILNVVVLYVILRAILYRPVRSYMLAREEALKQQRAEADQYRKDAEDLKAQSQKLLEEAHQTAQQDADSKLEYARQMASHLLEDAKVEARQIVEEGRSRIEEERKESREELVRETAALAVDLAARILGREVSAADNQRLIEDYFSKVG